MLIPDSVTVLKPLAGAGLLAGQYYDPCPPRFAANLKEILADGIPMVMRIHPGVRYPMSDDELFDRVDLEGHVAAFAGYDSERATIAIADPWPTDRFGGRYGGLHEEPEVEAVGTICVNSTLDFATTAVPLPVAIDVGHLSEAVIEVRATVRVDLPHAIRSSVSGVDDLVADIVLPDGVELVGAGRRRVDTLPAGGTTTLTWTATTSAPVDGRIEIAVAGAVRGTEPYPFSDVVGARALLAVRTIDRTTAQSDS